MLKEGDIVVADFTGTHRQVKGPMNAPYGVTASAVYNAILEAVDPTIPTNQGCFRPIRIVAPRGIIVNVNYPGAEFAGNTETHNLILYVVMGALARAIPKRVTVTGGDTCMNFTYGGTNPETGETFANYQCDMPGSGARATKDGNNTINAPVGNSRIQPIKVIESRYPWIH